MRKTKKPAIASEWRENKEAQQRADQKAAREQARVARAEAFARFSGAAGYLMIAGGWVVCIALAVLFGLSLATYSPADPGFSVTGTQKAANLCGIVGAWAADFPTGWLVDRPGGLWRCSLFPVCRWCGRCGLAPILCSTVFVLGPQASVLSSL